MYILEIIIVILKLFINAHIVTKVLKVRVVCGTTKANTINLFSLCSYQKDVLHNVIDSNKR